MYKRQALSRELRKVFLRELTFIDGLPHVIETERFIFAHAGIRDEKWSYALLPVWTLTYNDKARGKIYYFALNGQTGKICGKLPVDRKKIIILFFSVFLPLFLLLMTGGYFLG